MFKLVALPAHKKKDLLVVLDVLKHAYGLLFFMETFQHFLGRVNTALESHQANVDTFAELLTQYSPKIPKSDSMIGPVEGQFQNRMNHIDSLISE